MQNPSLGFVEFHNWLKSATLEQRTLLNAWRAGRHALLHGEVLPPPEETRKRIWRPVHPRWNKTFTVRGLSHRGEVTPQLTDGDKVIVRVNATGATFPTFFKNLIFLESGINHKPKSETFKEGKKTRTRSALVASLISEYF